MTSVDAADRTVARARPDASSGRQAGRGKAKTADICIFIYAQVIVLMRRCIDLMLIYCYVCT